MSTAAAPSCSSGDDDPVIAQYDVCAACSLSGNVHLLQFPLRDETRPYEWTSVRMFVTRGNTQADGSDGLANHSGSSLGHSSSGGGAAVGTGGSAPPAARRCAIHPQSRVTLACSLDTYQHAASFAYPNKSSSASSVKREDETTDRDDAWGDLGHYHHSYRLHSDPFTPRSQYALGVFHQDVLHLTPITTVQQLLPAPRPRPDLAATANPMIPAAAVPSGASVAMHSSVTVDDMHCSRKPEDALTQGPIGEMLNRQLRRQRSHVINADAETEQEFEYYLRTSVESAVVKKRLLSTTLAPAAPALPAGGSSSFNSSTPATPSVSGRDVLPKMDPHAFPAGAQQSRRIASALFPQEVWQDFGAKARKAIVSRFAADCSIAAQVRDLMQSAQVLSFTSLKRLVATTTATVIGGAGGTPDAFASQTATFRPPTASASGEAAQQMVEALRGCAVYMHGVWVAKHNEAFRLNSAALRELVLLKFWQSSNGSVRREEIHRLLLRPSSATVAIVKEILESIATVDMTKPPMERCWTLKEVVRAHDSTALAERRAWEAEFAADVQHQQEAWVKRAPLILGHVSLLDAQRQIKTLFLSPAAAATGVALSASSSSFGATGATAGGAPYVTAGANAVAAHLQHPTLATSSNTGAGAAAAAAAAAATSAGVPGLARSSAMPSASDPTVLKVRLFTRRLFLEHGVINKQRAKEIIAKSREEHYPTATNPMLSVAVQEEVQQFTPATWALKALHDKEVDRYRPYLMMAVQQLLHFESRVAVIRAIELMNQRALDEGSVNYVAIESIPERVVSRVLSEVAVYKQGERLWHVKSGNME